MKKGNLIKVQTEKMVSQGICLARYEGKVVLVENCLPGEFVNAKVKKIKKDFIEAVAEEIITASQFRVNSMCKYFGLCGGCKLQNLDYSQQLKIKKGFVEEALLRITKLQDIEVNDVLGSDNQYYYRNKMEFSFGKRWLFENYVYSEEEKNFALGLHIPKQFEKVIHLDECFLQSDFSNRVKNFIGEYLFRKNISIHSLKNKNGLLKALLIRESKNTLEKLIGLVTTRFEKELIHELASELRIKFPEITTFVNILSSENLSSTLPYNTEIIFGKGYIIEKLFDYLFEIYPNTFFQTNTKQAEKMFGIVKDYLESSQRISNNKVLIDLYSGVGVLGIIFSKYFDSVLAFENVKESVEAAKRNSVLNKIDNIRFYQQDLNNGFILDNDFLSSNLTVIVDPPRAGLNEKIITSILKIKPELIIYISCNPDTQARDLVKFKEYYSIELIQPVDMFPQAFHVENIIILKILSETT